MNTAVLLLAYNRPDLTRRVFKAIQKARPSRLYISQDGPRNTSTFELSQIKAVRDCLQIKWPCKVKYNFQTKNLGCKSGVSFGLNWFFSHENEGIVLEDDCLPHASFFSFCTCLLQKYRNQAKIGVINGTNFTGYRPKDGSSYYFTKYPHIWGWAGYAHVMRGYDQNIQAWPRVKETALWKNLFKNGFERDYWNGIMERTYLNKIDTWDYQFAMNLWVQQKICISPAVNLVENIGFGKNATHTERKTLISRLSQKNDLKHIIHPKKIELNLNNEEKEFKKIFQTPENKNKRKKKINLLLFITTKTFLKAIFKKISLFAKTKWRYPKDVIKFHGPYTNWADAKKKSKGYGEKKILKKIFSAAFKVKKGLGAFERDSVVFQKAEFEWPIVAILASAAASNEGRLVILDFGGSLGSSFFQNLPIFQDLKQLQWCIVEQPAFVQMGKKHFEQKELRFFQSIEEAVSFAKPHVVLLSGVLQYLEKPDYFLKKIWRIGADWVVFDKVIVNRRQQDEIYVQEVPPSIYRGSYPCFSFAEDKLLKNIPASYKMLSKIVSLPFPALRGIRSEFKGYVFRKK